MTFDEVAAALRENPMSQLGGGATDGEIARAEQDLAVALPLSYRRLLGEFGWVAIPGYFELHGLGAGVPSHLNLVGVTLAERSQFMSPTPTHLIPIVNDGAGNLYCLDTSRNDAEDSPVVLQDHEIDEIHDVAESFLEWLAAELSRTRNQS